MGHHVSNITDAMNELQRQKPQLAVQLRKSGTSKQARKTYRITTEGVKAAEIMIRGES
jgi:translation elongation factor EF-Ts